MYMCMMYYRERDVSAVMRTCRNRPYSFLVVFDFDCDCATSSSFRLCLLLTSTFVLAFYLSPAASV